MHGADDVALVADQPDIDGIAGNALRGARHHVEAGEALLVLVMGPQRRQHDIGEQDVRRHGEQQDDRGAAQPAALAFVTGVGRAQRRVSRQPAASASSTEQNQRVPLAMFILIFAYQRLVGW